MHPSPSRKMRGLPLWFGSDRGGGWLILVAATLVLCAAFVWHAFDAEKQRVELIAASAADAAAVDVERTVEQLDLILRTVMGGEQTPASPNLTEAQRDALLLERSPRDRFIVFLDVLDPSGNVLAKLDQNDLSNNWSNQDYFRILRDNPTIDLAFGLPFSTEHENTAGLTVARRIATRDGKFGGLIVIGVRVAELRELLGPHDFGASESVMLLRADGVVLANVPFDPRDIGHPVEPFEPFKAFSRSSKPAFSARGSVDGAEHLFLFRRIDGYPLVIGITIPLGEPSGPLPYLLGAGIIAFGAGFSVLIRRLWNERRARELAERQSLEKSQFLTMLSHELRTPLQGVLGYADQLSREHRLTPAQRRRLSEIVRSAKQMREVVNVVLDYARVEARGPTLHMRRFDVRQLAEECLAVIEPNAKARGLEVRCVAARDLPAHFITDDIQLRQILVNLLSNAVKYTPSGSIEMHLSGDDEHLTIEVIDTGIGIPQGQRHHLFHEYERFGTERTSIEGTGLGLAIAHRLARHLGGHLGHRDNPAGGSIFWVELPAGVADEPPHTDDSRHVGSCCGLRVLVVDDSDVNREVAAAFLRTAGHAVSEAPDGGDAVRQAASDDFDVVLMDMRMGGVDGLEATRRIRSINGLRGRVPIVAVTANALDQDAEACRRAGMSDHLAKPYTQAELLAVVTRAALAHGSKEPTVDQDSLAQLAACMDEEELRQLLERLALRIEALLRKLEDPAGVGPPGELVDLAHELTGSGGTLGFTRLASAARRFETAAASGSPDPADLRSEALAALSELRRRRSLEVMLSA